MVAAAHEVAPGTVIAGRYRIDRLLGEGGMGQVWEATHVVVRKRVALKLLKSEIAARPEARRRFVREARAASAVRHPNVIEIHDVIDHEGAFPVIVMDLLAGESLGTRLEREVRLSVTDTAAVALQVASALGTSHTAGIVHRDLKPDNVFLCGVGRDATRHVKVLDFGIAKLTAVDGDAAETGSITSTGSLLGTPYYMSPEQAFGERDIDHRTDVWSLGCILYECLTGERPFHGDNFGQLLKAITTRSLTPVQQKASEVPPDLAQLIERMLSVARDDRPADLREVSALLATLTDVTAPPFDAPRLSAPHAPSTDRAVRIVASSRVEVMGAASTVEAPSSLAPPASRTDDAHSLPASEQATGRLPRSRARLLFAAGGGLVMLAAVTSWWRGHAQAPAAAGDLRPASVESSRVDVSVPTLALAASAAAQEAIADDAAPPQASSKVAADVSASSTPAPARVPRAAHAGNRAGPRPASPVPLKATLGSKPAAVPSAAAATTGGLLEKAPF